MKFIKKYFLIILFILGACTAKDERDFIQISVDSNDAIHLNEQLIEIEDLTFLLREEVEELESRGIKHEEIVTRVDASIDASIMTLMELASALEQLNIQLVEYTEAQSDTEL